MFFLATQGGARVMGMAESLGSLDAGKLFDALVIDLSAHASPVPSAWRLRLEQFVFLADDRNISRVYVGGNLIHSKC
ncbi:metal-dependent hydrolase [Kickxella alabastrina]|uniref:metal-dependent hydrolase n=1 Tax=Kickxella alabastrina TaxID=61397 RepID=UPI00221E465C|nr:metal-dependent hydrolase [Kickxella alabastrina]KAI7830906.1 metal-dependent hydrolase [Kickxella alabastrina]